MGTEQYQPKHEKWVFEREKLDQEYTFREKELLLRERELANSRARIVAIGEMFVIRLGIPVIFLDEAYHGLLAMQSDVFPTSIWLACSWNTLMTEHIYQFGANQASL